MITFGLKNYFLTPILKRLANGSETEKYYCHREPRPFFIITIPGGLLLCNKVRKTMFVMKQLIRLFISKNLDFWLLQQPKHKKVDRLHDRS